MCETKNKDFYVRNHMPSEVTLEIFWIWTMKKQNIKEIICQAKQGKKNYDQGPKYSIPGQQNLALREEPGPMDPHQSNDRYFSCPFIYTDILKQCYFIHRQT